MMEQKGIDMVLIPNTGRVVKIEWIGFWVAQQESRDRVPLSCQSQEH